MSEYADTAPTAPSTPDPAHGLEPLTSAPEPPAARLNPAALAVPDAARVLSRLGGAGGRPITEDMLRDDIEAAAPTNADGSINLVHYGAWLVKQMGSGERGGD